MPTYFQKGRHLFRKRSAPNFSTLYISQTQGFADSKCEGSVTIGDATYKLGISKQVINESGYGFKAGKHELLPFPQQEMLLSGTIVGGPLVQNPGW
jgi:hypothetical protein